MVNLYGSPCMANNKPIIYVKACGSIRITRLRYYMFVYVIVWYLIKGKRNYRLIKN